MALGIGIDTGGTYTDAVVYDFNSNRVLCSSKALTTHDHLETGIINALSLLDENYFPKIEIVALSTTLATNACVENKGGRAKLMFFGVDKKVFDMVGMNYGLTNKNDVYLCQNSSDFNGSKAQEPEWDRLFSELDEWLSDAQGLGIVEVFAMNNGAMLEKAAKQQVQERYDIPVVCGHELFYELNSIQRGSSTLLNAKLIPIIQQFLESIKTALKEKNINAPIAVVRSDSTKMSEQYSKMKPVETILSGPASSVTGGINITDEQNCMIIDMGGTTTDISIVKNGIPLNADSGVKIGSWKTFVHGVYIDTFGLGGDSAIRVEHGKVIQLTQRMIPLCVAASRWPEINKELEELADSKKYHSYPLYEFLYLQKKPTNSSVFSKEELDLCRLVENSPMLLEKAANSLNRDIYTINTKRLEAEGIIIRIGLTPTDIMHLKKDFNSFDEKAPLTAVRYILSCILEETGIEYSLEEF
ncbi:MAG: hydantoinase/oxoprolinase family protein, partial [Clostridia bacterium]